MNVLRSLQQALYETISHHESLEKLVKGVYTAITRGALLPYVHISDIVTKRVPWNNKMCLECCSNIVVCTEGHDNLSCLEITDLVEKIICGELADRLLRDGLTSFNLRITGAFIAQNANDLTWEGRLGVALYIDAS